MILNYLFVITVLPAAIVLFKKDTGRVSSALSKFSIANRLDRFRSSVSEFVARVFIVWIPDSVEAIRLFVIPLSFVLIGLSVFVIVKKPGIRLPEKNSMQVLYIIRTSVLLEIILYLLKISKLLFVLVLKRNLKSLKCFLRNYK